MVANPPAEESAQLDVHPDRHLTYLLAKVSHQLELTLDRALDSVELTLMQFSALAHIARAPGLSNADLARALLISPQATSMLVRRLMARNLVHRPRRGRGVASTTRLTDTGLDTLRAAEEVALIAEQRALSALPTRRQDELADALHQLLRGADSDTGQLPDQVERAIPRPFSQCRSVDVPGGLERHRCREEV